MRNFMHRLSLLVAATFVLLATSTAPGATVNFTEGFIESSDGSTGNGVLGGPLGLVVAYDFDNAGPDREIDITDGTVTFANYSTLGSHGGSPTPSLTGDPDINDLVANADFGISGQSIVVGGMVPGHNYQLQVLSYLSNNVDHPTDVTVDGQAHSNWVINGNSTAFQAQVLTATWVQDVGETSLTISFGGGDPQVAGLILHDTDAAVPEPGSIVLAMLGLAGLCGWGFCRRRAA